MTISSYGSGPITHTIETLTWRELATELAAPLLARIPELRPRRITYIRRGTVAA